MNSKMLNERLWVMVAVVSVLVTCWGLWALFKPQPHFPDQFSGLLPGSLHGVVMEHVEHLPDVYRAHDSYAQRLHDDTCTILIYRYSPGGCSPCFLEDLADLKEFLKRIGKDIALVLPAYPADDRNTRIRLTHEMEGFRYRNIPADSLAMPVCVGKGEMRYFAIIDEQGQVGMVFLPVRGRKDLTQMYFKEVSRFFQ